MATEVKVYAPVIIPTLNRYEHLKRCVESLARCRQAVQTELIIGLDYPPSEKYVSGYKLLCDYLPTIEGFDKVTVLKADRNYGAIANIDRLRHYVRERGYDRYIFTEDDNEFSPNFLEYVNKGLDLYKDDDRIKSICGYKYLNSPQISDDSNIVAFREFSAWGYGQWVNKEYSYQICDKAEEYRNEILRSWERAFKLWRVHPISINDFLSMYFRNTTYGDALADAELFLEDKYCVYPSLSMVRNWGHDGSGEHCGDTDRFIKQEIDIRPSFEYGELQFSSAYPSGYVLGNWLADAVVLRAVTAIRYIGYRLFKKDVFGFRFNK